jgi:hypothetical protein
MGLACCDVEDDFDPGVESGEMVLLVVERGVEADAVDTGVKRLGFGEEMFAAAVAVGGGFVDENPVGVL